MEKYKSTRNKKQETKNKKQKTKTYPSVCNYVYNVWFSYYRHFAIHLPPF